MCMYEGGGGGPKVLGRMTSYCRHAALSFVKILYRRTVDLLMFNITILQHCIHNIYAQVFAMAAINSRPTQIRHKQHLHLISPSSFH